MQSIFKDVPLRTRRALSLHKVCDSALLALNRRFIIVNLYSQHPYSSDPSSQSLTPSQRKARGTQRMRPVRQYASSAPHSPGAVEGWSGGAVENSAACVVLTTGLVVGSGAGVVGTSGAGVGGSLVVILGAVPKEKANNQE